VAGAALGLVLGAAAVDLHGRAFAPNLAIVSPGAVEALRGEVTLVASADAAGLASLQFRIAGAPFGPLITVGRCATAWDTTGVPDGHYAISASGVGVAGEVVETAAVVARVLNHSGQITAAVTDITLSTAVVRWTTSTPANGRVEYGSSEGYGTVTRELWGPVTTHTVRLTGLAASTAYHFRVVSDTPAGAELNSLDAIFLTSGSSGGQAQSRLPATRRDEDDQIKIESATSDDYPRQLTSSRAQAMLYAHEHGLDFGEFGHSPGV
jgi:hypothetical protein